MEATTSKPISGVALILSAVALSIATLLIVLDYSIANVAIPYIAGDLGVSANEGIYVITAFAVGNAIILPITGWLTKRIGLVRLVFLSLLGFVVFSWVCGSSLSLPMLVTARFFQGIVSGPLIPTSQTLMISIFPKEKKARALTVWSTIVIVGPILGPILGGWIAYDYHWPWIFYINIPMGIFAAVVVATFLKPFETKKEKPPTDWLGLILLVIAVSTLQFLLDKGEQYNWLNSNIIRICIATSVISFVYLFVWEWYNKHPSLELKLLKIRSYSLSILLIGVMYANYFGSIVLIPLWLQEFMGYTPVWAGLAVAPIGILPFLFSWVAEKMVKKVKNLIPLGLSCALFSIACFVNAHFNTNISLADIAWTRLLFGAGIVFFVVPIFALCLRDLPEEKYPQGTGFFHFVRAMSGGIGTAVYTTLWVRRSAFHHSNIVSTVLPTNDPANAYYQTLERVGMSPEQQQAFINDVATKQASILGLNDSFYLMGWIFIALIPIIILARRKKRHAETPPISSHSPSS